MRTAAAAGAIVDSNWLPWLVYATERGYEYSGAEYWQSFEEKTPHWRSEGERAWIRQWFVRFRRRYGGVRPAGAWADHFTIICWPITHAILPRDLQRYLARVLYELRHSFNSTVLRDPTALGELIQARSWDASSRFQHLAQHRRLVGQIATALLLPEDEETRTRVLPETLWRIGQDLERERRARHWLRRAKASASQRLELRGLARPDSPPDPAILDRGLPRESVELLGMEPRLLLRPDDDGRWLVFLEFPDLSHLRHRFPGIAEVLSSSRCRVAGALGSPVPRSGFLFGRRRVRLARWPQAREVLVTFETGSGEASWVQSAESMLRPGPRWLTKICGDGLAHEVKSGIVRPGGSYIICSDRPIEPANWAQPIGLECEGAWAAMFALPEAVDANVARNLAELGLSAVRKLEVYPVGLPAASWDGEGRVEWVASHPACIGIKADHDVHRIRLENLDELLEPPLEVHPTLGDPVLVQLSSTSAAVHRVRVTSYSDSHSGPVVESGDLEVAIRDPRDWSAGVQSHAALWVEVDPSNPTLEELWEGKVAVSLRGPSDKRVWTTFSLLGREASEPIFEWTSRGLALPLGVSEWDELFSQFRHQPHAQRAYDSAQSILVEFDTGILGEIVLACEREASPLRWAVHSTSKGYRLKLLDDTGSGEGLTVQRFDFGSPAKARELEVPAMLRGQYAPKAGGLFVAQVAGHSRGVVVSASDKIKGFQALRLNPTIECGPRSVQGLSRLIGIMDHWSSARLSGDLTSAIRRQEVLTGFLQRVFGLIGGDRWASLEIDSRSRDGEDALAELASLVGRKPLESRFSDRLLASVRELAELGTSDRLREFRSITKRELPLPAVQVGDTGHWAERSRSRASSGIDWLLEFALRLASFPVDFSAWGGSRLETGIALLLEHPVLARGARFLVLAVDASTVATASGLGRPHAGWDWS